jgi:hypothetical protein
VGIITDANAHRHAVRRATYAAAGADATWSSGRVGGDAGGAGGAMIE